MMLVSILLLSLDPLKYADSPSPDCGPPFDDPKSKLIHNYYLYIYKHIYLPDPCDHNL